MIGFELTEKQKALRKEAIAIGKDILANAHETYAHLPDQRSRFLATLPIYRKLVAAGLIKGQVPTALGGTSDSFIDSAVTLEELYAADSSLMVHVVGTGLGLLPLLFGGTPEQKETLLKPFITGEGEPLASLTHSEPGGTANWLEKGGGGLGTTARLEGDYYVVNGEKLWTTNSAGWDGNGADLSCLCVRISEDPTAPEDPNVDPASNVLILLVTRDIVAQNTPEAYQMISEPDLMGHVAASGPHTRYTNFRVPATQVLAKGVEAASLVEQAFATSGALVGILAVGTMRSAFDEALKFVKSDTRRGAVPLLQRQSVADLLINIKIKIDTSRILAWKALDNLEKGTPEYSNRLEACLQAKVYCSDQAVAAVWEAMQVVGVTSYGKNTIFPRLLNDATVYSIFDGGNIGVRRRQLQKLMQADDYNPWATTS